MRFIKLLLLTAVALLNGSCSEEKNDLEIVIDVKRTYAVNAETASCFSRRTAIDGVIVSDITSAYFQIQRMGVYWPSDSRPYVISAIRFKFTHPALEGGTYKCEYAGDQLLALNAKWFEHGEAVVGGPKRKTVSSQANPDWTPDQLMQIDCAIRCGGLPQEASYTATGFAEVIGYHVESNGELTPNMNQTDVTIESFAF